MMNPEPYMWLAHRDDGEQVPEIEPGGRRRGLAEAQPIRALELLPDDPGLRPQVLVAPQGQRPTLWRRRSRGLLDGASPGEGNLVATIVGWNGAWLFLMPDGSVLLTDTLHPEAWPVGMR